MAFLRVDEGVEVVLELLFFVFEALQVEITRVEPQRKLGPPHPNSLR